MEGERKTELQRYQEIDGHSDNEGVPYIGSLCVVGRSFYAFGKRCDSPDTWYTRDADSNSGEVLMFLGGLLDQIPELRLKEIRHGVTTSFSIEHLYRKDIGQTLSNQPLHLTGRASFVSKK